MPSTTAEYKDREVSNGSYTERTAPSPLGTTLYPQTEATVAAIKFARSPMGYHLRRKSAQSR